MGCISYAVASSFGEDLKKEKCWLVALGDKLVMDWEPQFYNVVWKEMLNPSVCKTMVSTPPTGFYLECLLSPLLEYFMVCNIPMKRVYYLSSTVTWCTIFSKYSDRPSVTFLVGWFTQQHPWWAGTFLSYLVLSVCIVASSLMETIASHQIYQFSILEAGREPFG